MKEINTNNSTFNIKESESITSANSDHITGADFFIDILQSEVEMSKISEDKSSFTKLEKNTTLFEDNFSWQYETILAMQGVTSEDSDSQAQSNIFPVEISFDLPYVETGEKEIIEDDNNLITTLTIKASSQPWSMGPNLNYDSELISKNNGYFINTNFLVDMNQERFNDEHLLDNIQQAFSALDNEYQMPLAIESLEVKNCDFVVPAQTMHECNSYSYSINEIAATEKYESLSNSVKKQVIDAIEVRGINTKDSIEVTLYPDELGNIKIKCELQEKLIINFSFEKFSTLSLLQQSAPDLKDIIMKNFQSELGADMNFNMNKNQSGREYDDNNTTYQKPTHAQNDHNTATIKESVMYFLNDGKISLVV